MTPRRKRLLIVLGILAGVGAASALALQALRDNVSLFYDPSQVAAGAAPLGRAFRIGGMVTQGSVKREPGSLEVRFVVTDFKHSVLISYAGVLPDLFREGQGIVARGRMLPNGLFVADEVLAKHDEKYMPPEVAASLKKAGPPPPTLISQQERGGRP
jgi:cytochrome c-type biogenesis protein CcmE